jgi:hypothetical protein
MDGQSERVGLVIDSLGEDSSSQGAKYLICLPLENFSRNLGLRNPLLLEPWWIESRQNLSRDRGQTLSDECLKTYSVAELDSSTASWPSWHGGFFGELAPPLYIRQIRVAP